MIFESCVWRQPGNRAIGTCIIYSESKEAAASSASMLLGTSMPMLALRNQLYTTKSAHGTGSVMQVGMTEILLLPGESGLKTGTAMQFPSTLYAHSMDLYFSEEQD